MYGHLVSDDAATYADIGNSLPGRLNSKTNAVPPILCSGLLALGASRGGGLQRPTILGILQCREGILVIAPGPFNSHSCRTLALAYRRVLRRPLSRHLREATDVSAPRCHG